MMSCSPVIHLRVHTHTHTHTHTHRHTHLSNAHTELIERISDFSDFPTTNTLEIPKQMYPAFTQSSPRCLRPPPQPTSPHTYTHTYTSLSDENPWLSWSSAVYTGWPHLSQSRWWRWREVRVRKSKREVWLHVWVRPRAPRQWQPCPLASPPPPPPPPSVCCLL